MVPVLFHIQGFLDSFSRIHLSRETGSFVIITLHQKTCWKVKQERGLFLTNTQSRYNDIKEPDRLSGNSEPPFKILKEKTYFILKYYSQIRNILCLHHQIIRSERSEYVTTFVVRSCWDIHRRSALSEGKNQNVLGLLCEFLFTVKFFTSCASVSIAWDGVLVTGLGKRDHPDAPSAALGSFTVTRSAGGRARTPLGGVAESQEAV